MTDDTTHGLSAEAAERIALRVQVDKLREENARLRANAGPATGPVIRAVAEKPFFHQEDLANVSFFQAHKADIMAAMREGRIIPRTDWQVHGSKGSKR